MFKFNNYRAKLLQRLKNEQKLPYEMLKNFPEVSSLIMSMVNLDPKKRPSSRELKILCNKESDPSSSQLLLKQLETLKLENEKLKKEIECRDKVISNFEKQHNK